MKFGVGARTSVAWVQILGAAAILALPGPGRAQGDYVPPTFAGTGPYRRVYSHSDFSYVSATVYLPTAPSISMHGSDTPYVYTGGWGAGTGPSNPGAAVDAGFQYSPTFNNWSLFLSVAGVGRVSDPNPRFLADEAVQLQFEVVANGANVEMDVIADGTDVNHNPAHRVLTVMNPPGWVVGGANTLKRMTSIAQTTQDFGDGSFIDGVHWYNTEIGSSAATAVPWLAAETGGYESYPTTPGVVNVQYVNAGEETDSINLTPVPEPSGLALTAAGGAGVTWWLRRRKTRTPA